jgi:hypothetical protein
MLQWVVSYMYHYLIGSGLIVALKNIKCIIPSQMLQLCITRLCFSVLDRKRMLHVNLKEHLHMFYFSIKTYTSRRAYVMNVCTVGQSGRRKPRVWSDNNRKRVQKNPTDRQVIAGYLHFV